MQWESVIERYDRLSNEAIVAAEVEVTDLGDISASELEYVVYSNAIAEAEAAMERRLMEAKRLLSQYEQLKLEVARMKIIEAVMKDRIDDDGIYNSNGKRVTGFRSKKY